jgi:MFS family permease
MPVLHNRTVKALEWSNFFLADVQAGVGPFVAAYLAATGWKADRVGIVLTIGGIVSVLLQTPAGAAIDRARHKRALLFGGVVAVSVGALLLAARTTVAEIVSAEILIGAAGAFLGPTIAAITLGVVGQSEFDCQFGRNQSFNSWGNVASALLFAAIGYSIGSAWVLSRLSSLSRSSPVNL